MSQVHLLVRITVNPEAVEQLLPMVVALQQHSQQEQGCLRYQFFQDRDHPEVLYVQEAYADKQSFHAHANSDHMVEYLAASKSLIADVNMHKVVPLS